MQTTPPSSPSPAEITAQVDWNGLAQRALAWEHTPIAIGFVAVAVVSFLVGSHHRRRGGSRRGQWGWYVAAAWPAVQAFLTQLGLIHIGPPP